MSRAPIGFYTDKKKVVHPVCGPCSRYLSMVEKTKAKKHRPPRKVSTTKFVVGTPTHIRSRSHKTAIKGEAGLNARVTSPLARRFPGRLGQILDQAQSAYHYHHPASQQNAEPYELSEGGFIDEALESMGLPHVRTYGS